MAIITRDPISHMHLSYSSCHIQAKTNPHWALEPIESSLKTTYPKVTTLGATKEASYTLHSLVPFKSGAINSKTDKRITQRHVEASLPAN